MATGFCKFKIPHDHGRVIWEITNECNYGCKYCIFSSSGKVPEGELNTSECLEVIDQLVDQGFKSIKFTGGEPFLREDILDILEYAKNLNCSIDISTNASKITSNIAARLKKLNMDYIHVSLDGSNQIEHEIVRGKKSFLPTITGLKLLVEAGIYVRVGCVIHKENENSIEKIVQFLKDLGVQEVAFSMMSPVGRMKNKTNLLATKKHLDIGQEIDRIAVENIKISHNIFEISKVSFVEIKNNQKIKQVCPGGEKFLFINSIGVVSPCTWVSEHKPYYHSLNIKEYDLKNILRSYLFTKFNKIKSELNSQLSLCPMEKLDDFNNIEKKILKFHEDSFVYKMSTERLDYLKHLSFENKDVLTVTGSGDQALCLVLLKVKSVTCFDINKNANVLLHLKIQALKILNYQEFIELFFSCEGLSENSSLWKKLQLDLSSFHLDFKELNNLIKYSNIPYLESEEAYQLTQKYIHTVHIDIKHMNVLEAKDDDFVNKFDCILLSNIADYSHFLFPNEHHVFLFKEKVVIPFIRFLKPQGKIMFGYVFDLENIHFSDKRNQFNNKEVRKKTYQDLGKYFEIVVESAIPYTPYDAACFLEIK